MVGAPTLLVTKPQCQECLCSGQNVHIHPSKFMSNPNAQHDSIWKWGFGRWLGPEGGVLMIDEYLAPAALWEHSVKTDVKEPGSRPSPDTESTDAWSWTSWAWELWVNVGCYKQPSPWHFVITAKQEEGSIWLTFWMGQKPILSEVSLGWSHQRNGILRLGRGFVKQLELFFKPFGLSKTKNSFCQALSPIIFKPMCILREI